MSSRVAKRNTGKQMMNHTQPENTITVSCPSGHRLRGGPEMIGKNVKCPRCKSPFAFVPTNSSDSDHRAITDTGVMRILGDMPPLPVPSQPDPIDDRSVTDTGVMRILDDVSELSPQAKQPTETKTRPCSRCGVAIHESLAVCPHCSCYIGVMPSFMEKMTGDPRSSNK